MVFGKARFLLNKRHLLDKGFDSVGHVGCVHTGCTTTKYVVAPSLHNIMTSMR